MVEYEYDGTLEPVTEAKILVNNRRYFNKTTSKCPTCSAEERPLYVKQVLPDGQYVLECPVCDSLAYVKSVKIEKTRK